MSSIISWYPFPWVFSMSESLAEVFLRLSSLAILLFTQLTALRQFVFTTTLLYLALSSFLLLLNCGHNFAVVFMFKIISKILTPLQVICAISMHLLGQNLRCGGKSILGVVIQDYHLNHNNVLGSWSWYIQLLFANPNLPFLHCK